MGWFLTSLLLLSSTGPLPSRALAPDTPLLLPAGQPVNFDLVDLREEVREEARNVKVEDPHTIFVIKRHVGASLGYDNSVLHGSVGLYMTIAELGRWNFGIPSVGFGMGRYPSYDRVQQQASRSNEPTVFISMVSVHYRLGYIKSFGFNGYLNLEQVYDVRHNMSGSQFGFSFSTK